MIDLCVKVKFFETMADHLVQSPGQVCTYQLATQQPSGVSYKITPETTEEELNVMKCFQVNGTKDEPVSPQGTLPDLQGFQVR